MAKKTPKQRARDELDAIVGKIVKWRDGYQCYCQSRENIQAGHVIGRAHYGLRYDLGNVHAQCSSCNLLHNRPDYMWRYHLWISRRFGAEGLDWLLVNGSRENKFSAWTLTDMRDELERLREIWKKRNFIAISNEKALTDMGFYGSLTPIGPRFLSERHMKR